jgi:hypothetical protein
MRKMKTLMDKKLQDLVDQAKDRVSRMTPEEYEHAMDEHKKSFVRSTVIGDGNED